LTQKYDKNCTLTFFHLLSTGCKRFAGDVVKGWVTESYKEMKTKYFKSLYKKKKNTAINMHKSSAVHFPIVRRVGTEKMRLWEST